MAVSRACEVGKLRSLRMDAVPFFLLMLRLAFFVASSGGIVTHRVPRVSGKAIRVHDTACLGRHRLEYDIVFLDGARLCQEMALYDQYCLLGSLVVRRTGGWPRGGSFSEPAAMIDSSHEDF